MITKEFAATLARVNGQSAGIPFQVVLSYDADEDPFAVQLICQNPGSDDVVWHFSRELLVRGSSSLVPVGIGDVRVMVFGPGGEWVGVCLVSPDGHACLEMPYEDVFDFLNETDDAALCGIEAIDHLIDEAIEEILNS